MDMAYAVLKEAKKRIREKMKASFVERNKEEGHGLCFASEIIDEVALEFGVDLGNEEDDA